MKAHFCMNMFGGLLLYFASILHFASFVSSLNTVAVFGGSGFIGRRVCRQLVESGQCEAVVSISRSGRPPSYYCDGPWVDSVQWISYDLDNDWPSTADQEKLRLPTLDAAVSCIGNVQPKKEWTQLFGLGFDDDRLRYENGVINERAIELAKSVGAKRFSFVSVSYESAKTLEGPIVGYMDGKRMCEEKACEIFGEENTVLIGPSLVYGGKRYPNLGRIYRSFVESPPARAYVAGNDFLRNLSTTPVEDWLEKMIFSSPVDVDTVARVLCAGSLGLINRGVVGGFRQQDFYDTNGQPVTYPDALFVDGTAEIERVSDLMAPYLVSSNAVPNPSTPRASSSSAVALVEDGVEPPFEGALVGKGPLLYPLPVVLFFGTIFWSVTSQQFVQVSS